MEVVLDRDRMGNYLLTAEGGEDILFQVDYDHASLAAHLGWELGMVEWGVCKDCNPTRRFIVEPDQGDCPCPEECPSCGGENVELDDCDHPSSDGTVDCSDCGMPTMAFIESAQHWLDAHLGESFEDVGYFDEE